MRGKVAKDQKIIEKLEKKIKSLESDIRFIQSQNHCLRSELADARKGIDGILVKATQVYKNVMC